MESRYKHLSDIEYLKDYPSYAIDTEGNVWSYKYRKKRKLSPGWKRRGYGYQFVRLSDKYGKMKNFAIHRLLAIAFIPTDDINKEVRHKNGIVSDNRLENLEWKDIRKVEKFNGYLIDDSLANKIKDVHTASIRKGLKVPDSNTFIHDIIEKSLNDHINQFGLRKVMLS